MRIDSLAHAFTRRFLTTTIILLVTSWGAFLTFVLLGTSVDVAAKTVDAIFKIAAVVVGAAWTLNRYFTARTDELQLRVDPVAEFVSNSLERDMFICRLDIVNTAKALTPAFAEVVEIASAIVHGEEIRYQSIMRWPEEGLHRVAPIEPGSWSALSFATPIEHSVRVVRIFLQLKFDGGKSWTWHRHFAAPPESTRK